MLWGLCIPDASGHDIPDERVDRAIQILLEPPTLRVTYELNLSEWTLFQDLKRLAPELPSGDRLDRIEGYAGIVAPLNARGLLTSVDGSELSWQVDGFDIDFEQHAVLTFHFRADIPESGRLRLRDTNYVSSYGTGRLAMRVAPGTLSTGFDGPPTLSQAPEIPIWAMSDEQEEQTRTVEVDYRPSDGPASVSEPGPTDSGPKPGTTPELKSEPEAPPPRVEAPDLGERSDRLTRVFFDPSGRTTPLLVLAALVIGAAHAVQPGHGKTVVAGVSIQGRRPLGRGLLLAGSAAASHFAVAVVLAVLAVMLMPEGFDRIDSALTRAIGLLLGILGAWRIGASLNGSSSASPTNRDEERAGRLVESSREAILSGLAIGAIPCWDAVLLLAMAWVAGQAALGVALLIAFSLGASMTLLGVALLAGLFRTIARRLTASAVLERSLGLLGGGLLAGIGGYLFLC